jgi:type IV pilus assembly protein PilO
MTGIEQLVKIPLAKKVAVLVLVAVLVAVGFFFVYYSPRGDELDRLRNQNTTLISKKKEAERSKAVYDKDLLRRDELRRSYTAQLRALPSVPEISSFLNSLNTQADVCGLEILAVKPLSEEPAEYYARIPVQLKLRGSYHQLAKFFYLVGNLDRIINIENMSLQNPVGTESGVQLQADVLATTFRSVQPGEPTGKKGKKGAAKKKAASKPASSGEGG